MKKLMKNKNYLELAIYHPDSTLYEYPSRYCIIRIPFDKIECNSLIGVLFNLSDSQVSKLHSIGFDKNYNVIARRPCDKNYVSAMNIDLTKFYSSFAY